MIHFDGASIGSRLQLRAMIDRLATTMRERPSAPVRQRLVDPHGREFLVMPAMVANYAGIKSLTIVPQNRGTQRPVISGLFTLFELETGRQLATMDAEELTARRTSAISAAAAEYLARDDASNLLVLGSGHLAPYMAAAHAVVRPIETIRIWARDADRAKGAVDKIRSLLPSGSQPDIVVAADLEEATRSADIVTAATSATAPLIRGKWLRPGTHVDLVGSYRPDMREIDDEGISRARIFVDDRAAALTEAGDLTDPIARGLISRMAICGELADLCAGHGGRVASDEITLFKSVGTGIADLVAAIEVWESGASLH
ncbi:ornithine cyclodeaminase family protein [Sphingomonas sp.]|uniref:ornithine cyclodeaminase family protein n=1 Tax=Sphingomonas sp. TaxID=28214 RepID=UPI003F7DC281